MFKATIQGGDVTLKFLSEMGVAAKARAYIGVSAALQLALEKSREVLSANDHSQHDLDMMGNPYSAAHPQTIHSPDVTVHSQSGDYLRGLRAVPPTGTASGIVEGKIINEDEKDRWIQEGTLTMRARPWMEWVARMFGERLIQIIADSIKQGTTADASRRGGALVGAATRGGMPDIE